MADEPEQPKNSGGRPKGLGQLSAIRAAAAMEFGDESDRPEVATFLRLREEDIKAFTAMWERLEAQAATEKNRKKDREAAEPKDEVVPAKKDDGYDRYRDEVTPKLERLIEAWLKKTKARVESLPG